MGEEKKYTYKNVTSQTQALINIGEVRPGETIETTEPIHNSNFVLVNAGRIVNVEAPTEQPKINKNLKAKN